MNFFNSLLTNADTTSNVIVPNTIPVGEKESKENIKSTSVTVLLRYQHYRKLLQPKVEQLQTLPNFKIFHLRLLLSKIHHLRLD